MSYPACPCCNGGTGDDPHALTCLLAEEDEREERFRSDLAAERAAKAAADREANDAEIRDRFDRSKVDPYDNAWGFDGELSDLADMED